MSDSFAARPLDRGAPFYVAGHRGLVGSSVWRKLESAGFSRLLGQTSAELDLRDREAVFDFFAREKPTNVIL
ncbi:NAD-dependent epimerase/dehydratase family protein, partial [Rhodococcus erythropolis]|nr:NAD-dependent epimerase/dehydratase family protein [Rhodococcus erythropolis]